MSCPAYHMDGLQETTCSPSNPFALNICASCNMPCSLDDTMYACKICLYSLCASCHQIQHFLFDDLKCNEQSHSSSKKQRAAKEAIDTKYEAELIEQYIELALSHNSEWKTHSKSSHSRIESMKPSPCESSVYRGITSNKHNICINHYYDYLRLGHQIHASSLQFATASQLIIDEDHEVRHDKYYDEMKKTYPRDVQYMLARFRLDLHHFDGQTYSVVGLLSYSLPPSHKLYSKPSKSCQRIAMQPEAKLCYQRTSSLYTSHNFTFCRITHNSNCVVSQTAINAFHQQCNSIRHALQRQSSHSAQEHDEKTANDNQQEDDLLTADVDTPFGSQPNIQRAHSQPPSSQRKYRQYDDDRHRVHDHESDSLMLSQSNCAQHKERPFNPPSIKIHDTHSAVLDEANRAKSSRLSLTHYHQEADAEPAYKGKSNTSTSSLYRVYSPRKDTLGSNDKEEANDANDVNVCSPMSIVISSDTEHEQQEQPLADDLHGFLQSNSSTSSAKSIWSKFAHKNAETVEEKTKVQTSEHTKESKASKLSKSMSNILSKTPKFSLSSKFWDRPSKPHANKAPNTFSFSPKRKQKTNSKPKQTRSLQDLIRKNKIEYGFDYQSDETDNEETDERAEAEKKDDDEQEPLKNFRSNSAANPLDMAVFPCPKSRWIPDKTAKKCMCCEGKFGSKKVFKSGKHHCRKCGLVVCTNCSERELKGHRVCDRCYSRFQQYELAAMAADLRDTNPVKPVDTKRSDSSRLFDSSDTEQEETMVSAELEVDEKQSFSASSASKSFAVQSFDLFMESCSMTKNGVNGKYLARFYENGYDDIRMMEFVDRQLLMEEIGLKNKLLINLVLKRVEWLKESQLEFKSILLSKLKLPKRYILLLNEKGIVNMEYLVRFVPNREGLKTQFAITNTPHLDALYAEMKRYENGCGGVGVGDGTSTPSVFQKEGGRISFIIPPGTRELARRVQEEEDECCSASETTSPSTPGSESGVDHHLRHLAELTVVTNGNGLSTKLLSETEIVDAWQALKSNEWTRLYRKLTENEDQNACQQIFALIVKCWNVLIGVEEQSDKKQSDDSEMSYKERTNLALINCAYLDSLNVPTLANEYSALIAFLENEIWTQIEDESMTLQMTKKAAQMECHAFVVQCCYILWSVLHCGLEVMPKQSVDVSLDEAKCCIFPGLLKDKQYVCELVYSE